MTTDLYWIQGPWPGRLAILARLRGGDWLEDQIVGWKQAGLNVVVSALEEKEVQELGLSQEAELAKVNGIEWISIPIADRQVPESVRATAESIRRIEGLLVNGKSVGIHCRQGVGRSALLAACLLVLGAVEVAEAFARISAARDCAVPETREQRDWGRALAREVVAVSPGR